MHIHNRSMAVPLVRPQVLIAYCLARERRRFGPTANIGGGWPHIWPLPCHSLIVQIFASTSHRQRYSLILKSIFYIAHVCSNNREELDSRLALGAALLFSAHKRLALWLMPVLGHRTLLRRSK